jgi:hypothetical protein
MTVVVEINGEVIKENVFPLLPVTRLEIDDSYKAPKKYKIPWPGKESAGCIFSCGFLGITRGLIKSNKKKSFRNSVGIDICTSTKNVAAKLSRDKIHMCGPNSTELALETAQYIVNHLLDIQKELDYISAHLHDRDEVIKWLIKETKGERFVINEETQEIIKLEEGEYIKGAVVHTKDGQTKYNYKEASYKSEEGDTINNQNIMTNKKGEPYYRLPSKREKKIITEYPLLVIGEEYKIEQDKTIRDAKGNKIHKYVKIPLRVVEVLSLKVPTCLQQSPLPDTTTIPTTSQSPDSSQVGRFSLNYPKNINVRIANFLVKYIQDYAYHHVFCEFLENFKDIDRVFIPKPTEGHSNNDTSPTLSLGDMNIIMINYSYSLGMNVDRWALAQLIDGYSCTKNDDHGSECRTYKATYNNTTDHHVTISVPYEADNNEIIKRKSHNVSFMVYKSGIVTQSGPSPAIMKNIYYDFMNFINEHREEIKLKDDKPFSIKFKPISYTSEDF